jgi:hypothetical protein
MLTLPRTDGAQARENGRQSDETADLGAMTVQSDLTKDHDEGSLQ